MACSLPDLSLLLDKDNRDNKKPHRQDEEPPDSCGTREEPMDTHSHPGVINLHASHASIANPSLLATFKDKLLEFDEGQDGSNDPAHDQAAHPNSLPTPSVEPTPQLSKVVAKGKNVISLKTKVSRPRAATTINNAFVTIGRHFVLQAGSSKQQFQACTPHAIVHLDRNKHSIVVAIYCPDSEQPVLTTVPSTSPLDPTEPPDNHSVPFIAISCD
ncbi:hypothetical protein V6N13_057002 [Hibiscus sabdariffa]